MLEGDLFHRPVLRSAPQGLPSEVRDMLEGLGLRALPDVTVRAGKPDGGALASNVQLHAPDCALPDPKPQDAVNLTTRLIARQQPRQQPPGALLTLDDQLDRVGLRTHTPDSEGIGGEVPVRLDDLVEEVGLEVPLLVAVRIRDRRSLGAEHAAGLLVGLVRVLLAAGGESADPSTAHERSWSPYQSAL
ncbi:hypothetical protein, partial [Streptomyces avermitilis]|uniref:hypothetical protein n=1 Tax=Streptomyces avermitilis TaxID=33903 RepID=UPI0033B64777